MLQQGAKITGFLLLVFVFNNFLIAQDTTSINIIVEVKVIGNKTTKRNIILRELPFQIGDTLLASQIDAILERTKSNLMNTQLFNFVTLSVVGFDDTHMSIYIAVEERWYWWPVPIFELEETNFNTWWNDRSLDRVNYGALLIKDNFRGRKERLAFKFQLGYRQEIGFRYDVPYLNKKKTKGMRIGAKYNRNHEVNYATTANKFDYYKSNHSYIREEFSAQASYDYRPKLYNLHRIQLDYNHVKISDSVVFYNPNYLADSSTSAEYLSFRYYLNRDKRNLKWYPTKGFYYSFQIKQDGFGFFDGGINSFTSTLDYRKYFQLSDKLYLASSIKGKYSFTKAPYYLQEGLGFGSTLVRGYELYVVKGDHYGLFKTQLRYQLFSKTYKLSPVPLSKFNKVPLSIYLGAFFDAGYVDSQSAKATNFLINQGLFGGGIGVDFVSYYDIVFRLEYSVNRMKEAGLFFHFVAPL